MDDQLRLRDQIRDAFPPTPFSRRATACSCDECVEIRNALRGRAWDQIPIEFVDLQSSPTLFTPEAVQAFLPAFLLRSLDDLSGDSIVLEMTVYGLCPDRPEPGGEVQAGYQRQKLLAIASLMSEQQIAAVRAFLTFVVEHAANREWLRQFVDPALDAVWLAQSK